MDDKTTINCYKFSDRPDLARVAGFFQIPPLTERDKYILLRPGQVNEVLKFNSENKYVWLFQYGCISLVNFEAAETCRFLRYLETTCGPIDFQLFSTYNESHILEFSFQEPLDTQLATVGLYATILAKSTELKSLEDTVRAIIDQSEQLILDLQQGFSESFHCLLKLTTKIVRLQMKMINDLHLLDRPTEYGQRLEERDLYHSLADFYELRQRYEIIQEKMTDLKAIITPYQKLNFVRKEKRLFIMEIILLALFPLFRIIAEFL